MRSFCVAGIVAFTSCAFAQPYQPTVIWDRSGLTDSSSYGTQVLPLGDQNDDGFADWAVMAWGNIGYGGSQRPYLEFFRGGPTPSTTPHFVFQQDSALYRQVWSAWGIGDLNGDGYRDWMTVYREPDFPPYRLWGIFLGGHGPTQVPDVGWTLALESSFYSLADFDFNGDGFADLFWRDVDTDEARVYYGASPLDTFPDWIRHTLVPGINNNYPAAVGDFNGDGASDFIWHDLNLPRNTAVFLGGANPDTVPAYFWSSMPRPLGGVPSLNGDVADEWLGSAANTVPVYFGSTDLASDPSTAIQFSCTYALRAAGAGDFNADGYHDLLLWNDQCDGNMFGAIDLHLGAPWLNPAPAFTIEGDWPDGLINIYTAAGLGDVNGDGADDFAVGAWDDFAYLGWRGRCVIVAGDTSLMVSANQPRPEIPQMLTITAYPNPFNSVAMIELEVPPSEEPVTVALHNVAGQLVRFQEVPSTRRHSYQLDARDLPSGVYFLEVHAAGQRAAIKLLLLR